MPEPLLSICIATYQRGNFISETLDSILPQMKANMELIVVDGASPDNTSEVLDNYSQRHPALKYFREEKNSGVDADYDKAVGYAEGLYVWLMTDDDLLVPGAIDRIEGLLAEWEPDLLVVDAEVRDAEMSQLLQARRFGFEGVRLYGAQDCDALLADAGDVLSFIGGTIVRRSLWLDRDREAYFGTLFIHVGVLLQENIGRTVLLGEPLIRIRFGNAMWSARGFEIWMFKWPELIWSFEGFSETAKSKVTARRPWRSFRKMLGFRANGSYSLNEYRTFFGHKKVGLWRGVLLLFALLPGKLANLIAMLLLLAANGRYRAACFALAHNSRFALPFGGKLALVSYRRHRA